MPDVLNDQLLQITLDNVSNGQNSKDHPRKINQGQASVLTNVKLQKGLRRKRGGSDLIANDITGVTSIRGLSVLKNSNIDAIINVASGGVVAFPFEWIGTGNWVQIPTALFSPNIFVNMVTANDLIFFLSETVNVFSYDGVTVIDEGNTNLDPPRSVIGEWAQERLFLVDFNTSVVMFSDALAPQTFVRDTNSFSFDTGDNTIVTALKEATNQELLVWKERSIHLLFMSGSTPLTDWSIQEIDHEFGAIATRSVAQAGSDWFFLSQQGVRRLLRTAQDKPQGASIPVSDPIEDFIKRIKPDNIQDCVAQVFDNKYYLSVPLDASTVIDTTFVFDIIEGGWTVYEGWTPNAWTVHDFGTGERLYFGDSGDGKVFQAETGTFNDNGVAIKFTEETGRLTFGLASNDKAFQHIEIEAVSTGSSTLSVFAQVDGGGFTLLGTMDLTGDIVSLPVDLPFTLGGGAIVKKKFSLSNLGKGRDVQLKLEHDTLDQDVQILSVTPTAYPDNYEFDSED